MNRQLNIEINIGDQVLVLREGDSIIREYPVSTAKNGAGEKQDSECTPRGKHTIAEKIGNGCAENTVFVARVPTGEIYSPQLRREQPDRDWILTRILWLRGMEPGQNQGDGIDSYNRFIYIHGSPRDVTMGKPGSRGCIRMRNNDVIDLFEKVSVGTEVYIHE